VRLGTKSNVLLENYLQIAPMSFVQNLGNPNINLNINLNINSKII